MAIIGNIKLKAMGDSIALILNNNIHPACDLLSNACEVSCRVRVEELTLNI